MGNGRGDATAPQTHEEGVKVPMACSCVTGIVYAQVKVLDMMIKYELFTGH